MIIVLAVLAYILYRSRTIHLQQVSPLYPATFRGNNAFLVSLTSEGHC